MAIVGVAGGSRRVKVGSRKIPNLGVSDHKLKARFVPQPPALALALAQPNSPPQPGPYSRQLPPKNLAPSLTPPVLIGNAGALQTPTGRVYRDCRQALPVVKHS